MARPKGGYKVDGEVVPGTTTVIGRFKDTQAIQGWTYKQGIEIGRQIELGKIDPANIWKREVRFAKLDGAAAIGNVLHDYAEASLRKQMNEDVGELIPEVYANLSTEDKKLADNAMEAFRRHPLVTTFTPVLMEEPMTCPDLRFGGTPDLVGTDASQRLWVVDHKTSSGFYSDMIVQLAAYRHLVRVNTNLNPEDGMVWRFSKDGRFTVHDLTATDLDMGMALFRLYREAYDLDKQVVKITKS